MLCHNSAAEGQDGVHASQMYYFNRQYFNNIYIVVRCTRHWWRLCC